MLFRKRMEKFHIIKQFTLKVGDIIDGKEILEINKDPFISNQINIVTDNWVVNEFGDEEQQIIRIRSMQC